MNEFNNVPKHKKKATKQQSAKSDHKHNYEPVLLRISYDSKRKNGFYYYLIGIRCRICGKTGLADNFLPIRTDKKDGKTCFSFPKSGEIPEEYKNIPIVDYTF